MSSVPPIVIAIAERAQQAGGRALLVGGCVRDDLLDRSIKDWDVEVYGLAEAALERELRALGPVNAVGRSFGVFKLGSDAGEIDVSLPRRDSNVGPGHRGILVEGDPNMSISEAAKRRDLTINAILRDPLTNELLDPHGGCDDLKKATLRAVDEQTFLEDPLRALRVIQFAARLEFSAEAQLKQLCRRATLNELPPERVRGEWLKLMVKGVKPSIGLRLANETFILKRVFPDFESPVEGATRADEFAKNHRSQVEGEGRQFAAMIAAWLGGHGDAECVLDPLALHSWMGFKAREHVLAWCSEYPKLPSSDADLRHLSTRVEVDTYLRLVECSETPRDALAWRVRAHEFGVAFANPQPLVLGRDLLQMGITPGPHLGVLLDRVYTMQLDGQLDDRQQALQVAQSLVNDHGTVS